MILMYHRIIPTHEVEKGVQPGMYVDPATFRTHLEFLQNYFTIIPITDLAYQGNRHFRNSNDEFRTSNNKPRCVLTFDDGWYDFYAYAFPILKEHNIPATVFLPTNFMGTNRWFWTDRLAYLIKQRAHIDQSTSQTSPSLYTVVNSVEEIKGSYEIRLEKAIDILKSFRDKAIEEVISQLSLRWNINPTPHNRVFLTWKEIKEMHRSGLITFGSHTASHNILTTLTDEEIQDELTKSKENLIAKHIVDPSFIPFCYPNGNFNENIARMVKESGYSLAVTTKKGWNNAESDPFTLRRIGIHQDMSSTKAMFACRIEGIL